MERLFDVSISSTEKAIYEGKASSLIIPSSTGYFGVLADHAPLISDIAVGKIILRSEGGKILTFQSTGSGFVEVLENKVILLYPAS